MADLRERIAAAIFNTREQQARSFSVWTDENIAEWRRESIYDQADAVLAILPDQEEADIERMAEWLWYDSPVPVFADYHWSELVTRHPKMAEAKRADARHLASMKVAEPAASAADLSWLDGHDGSGVLDRIQHEAGHPSPAASSGDLPLSAPWGSDKGEAR